jgi:probable addiction module antidote protein
MVVKTTRWDSAKHLKSERDIRDYMKVCMEEAGDDPAFIAHALGVIARARNISQLARETGMSREGLYKAFSSDGNPSFAAVMKLAKALGFRVSLRPL